MKKEGRRAGTTPNREKKTKEVIENKNMFENIKMNTTNDSCKFKTNVALNKEKLKPMVTIETVAFFKQMFVQIWSKLSLYSSRYVL